MSQADNICRWTGAPGHYEVWYLTCNHRDSHTGYWIRYTLEAPLPDEAGPVAPYAQLWFARFDARDPGRNVAFNRKLPIEALGLDSSPFAVSIDDARLQHDHARGALRGAGHEVSWDLGWSPAVTTHRHLPGLMYLRGGLGETTVLSPNLDVAMSGTITCDGDTVELAAEPGGQTHLWGSKHAHAWAWGHCNAFQGAPGAALEILSVRLKRAGRVLPGLTLFTLYLDGHAYRFSEFHHTLLTRARYDTARYQFRGTTPTTRIEGEFTCRPHDMVVAPYVDPDGEPSYCANTCVGDLDVTVSRRRGLTTTWTEHARLRASGTAHFEIGGRRRDPAVLADHVTVDGHGAK